MLYLLIILLFFNIFEGIFLLKNKNKKDDTKSINEKDEKDINEKDIKIDYTKTNENRKFVIGDVVLYDVSNQQYNDFGYIDYDIKPYTRTGIMLIGYFDYDSDKACRASIGRSALGKKGIIYSNFSPSGSNYRHAKKCHIRKFLKEIMNDKTLCKNYAKEIETLKSKI